jgi:DNA-binding NtrC family response regulator
MLAGKVSGSIEQQPDPIEKAAKIMENSHNSNQIQGRSIRGKRILLVDQSKRIRDALNIFFEIEGCSFQSLGSPNAALEVLHNDAYDIIIADYHLSGINGLELLNIVKLHHPKTTRILTTGYDNGKLVEEAKAAGIRDVLKKPFSADTLVSHLLQLFEYG